MLCVTCANGGVEYVVVSDYSASLVTLKKEDQNCRRIMIGLNKFFHGKQSIILRTRALCIF